MSIQVFKTNITKKNEAEDMIQKIRIMFNVQEINIDLEDKDKVLRMECDTYTAIAISLCLKNYGYKCEELV